MTHADRRKLAKINGERHKRAIKAKATAARRGEKVNETPIRNYNNRPYVTSSQARPPISVPKTARHPNNTQPKSSNASQSSKRVSQPSAWTTLSQYVLGLSRFVKNIFNPFYFFMSSTSDKTSTPTSQSTTRSNATPSSWPASAGSASKGSSTVSSSPQSAPKSSENGSHSDDRLEIEDISFDPLLCNPSSIPVIVSSSKAESDLKPRPAVQSTPIGEQSCLSYETCVQPITEGLTEGLFTVVDGVSNVSVGLYNTVSSSLTQIFW